MVAAGFSGAVSLVRSAGQTAPASTGPPVFNLTMNHGEVMRISIFALFLPLVLWMPSVVLNAAPGDDGPVQHCVLLQFKEGADSAQTMALLNRFARVWE